jgi:hypothetical protein
VVGLESETALVSRLWLVVGSSCVCAEGRRRSEGQQGLYEDVTSGE